MRKACLAEGAHKKSRSKQSEGKSSKEADPARRTAELHKHTGHKVHAVPCRATSMRPANFNKMTMH